MAHIELKPIRLQILCVDDVLLSRAQFMRLPTIPRKTVRTVRTLPPSVYPPPDAVIGWCRERGRVFALFIRRDGSLARLPTSLDQRLFAPDERTVGEMYGEIFIPISDAAVPPKRRRTQPAVTPPPIEATPPPWPNLQPPDAEPPWHDPF